MFRREQGEPRRFKRYKYGPGGSRLVIPVVSIVAGIVFLLIGFFVPSHGVFTWFDLGIFLIAFGVIGFLVGLYLGRKGL